MKKLWELVNKSSFLRFCITGALNTLVDTGIYTALINLLGVNIYIAQVFGYSAGIVNSYCINRSWTFRSKSSFFGREMYRFLLVNVSILLMSLALMYALNKYLALHYLVMKAVTVVFTISVGFVLNRMVVFKD